LWHYPIYIAMRLVGLRGLRLIVIGACISFLVASASFYFLERPILKLKNRPSPSIPNDSIHLTDVALPSTATTEA
jgi:peptidoglycan/LPS O-acetylase OafA/YrhL